MDRKMTSILKTTDQLWREDIRPLIKEKFKAYPVTSPHEGYGTILGALDCLWDEIKTDRKDLDFMQKATTNLAATVIRFLHELPLMEKFKWRDLQFQNF